MSRIFLAITFLITSFATAYAETIPRPQARPAYLGLYGSVPTTLKDQDAKTCIAVAIYHEARGESRWGQMAVASVIVQRSYVKGRWGDDACSVVSPVQFAFLNKDGSFAVIDDMKSWSVALQIAEEMTTFGPLPELRNADHYHTTNISPYWASSMVPVRIIGKHIFYADPTSKT